MQDWKIKRMSIKLLERWLDSVNKLLLYYLGAEGTGMPTCPLCWADCKECLWIIIERKSCDDFRDELYPGEYLLGVSELRRNLKRLKWKAARIKQLERWRCIISHELANRYVKKPKGEK